MQFFSTRDQSRRVSASQAIAQGLSEEGGLFVPESFPQVDVKALCGLDYPAMAAAVLPTAMRSAARRAISPRWKGTPGPWNCGTGPPAPSRITRCS